MVSNPEKRKMSKGTIDNSQYQDEGSLNCNDFVVTLILPAYFLLLHTARSSSSCFTELCVHGVVLLFYHASHNIIVDILVYDRRRIDEIDNTILRVKLKIAGISCSQFLDWEVYQIITELS